MNILITNDDSVYSPGLRLLASIASKFGNVRVVAPDFEQSSMGHAITGSRPLFYKKAANFTDVDAWRVNGTPADCVSLGTHLWSKTDVVLSGINLGSNLGNSMWHSGTLAGAKQAVLLGIKGIALSAPVDNREPNLDYLTNHVYDVLKILLADKEVNLINVNFPKEPTKGIKWTRQSVRQYDGQVVPGTDPMGRKHYWITVKPLAGAEEGTDRWAVEEGYISMTPLRLDLTDEKALAKAVTKESTVKAKPEEPVTSSSAS